MMEFTVFAELAILELGCVKKLPIVVTASPPTELAVFTILLAALVIGTSELEKVSPALLVGETTEDD